MGWGWGKMSYVLHTSPGCCWVSYICERMLSFFSHIFVHRLSYRSHNVRDLLMKGSRGALWKWNSCCCALCSDFTESFQQEAFILFLLLQYRAAVCAAVTRTELPAAFQREAPLPCGPAKNSSDCCSLRVICMVDS